MLVAPSQTIFAGGVLPSTCPKGTTLGDGCLQANPNAVFQTSSFFTCTAATHCALTPSQKPYAAVPPWNVAGVSYPVGYDKTLSLKDPTTAALPSGCSYNRSITMPMVLCKGVHGLDLEGYDFGNTTWDGQTTSGGCVRLQIAGNVTGAIIIKNNRWFNGKDATHRTYGCNVNNGTIVQIETNSLATSASIVDNYCDLNVQNVPSPGSYGIIACFTSLLEYSGATVDFEYNTCFNVFARCSEMQTSNGLKTIAHNYLEYLSYPGAALHGEFDQSGADTSCWAVGIQSYNTVLQPASAATGSVTSLLYLSSGAKGPCWASYMVANNTTVVQGQASVAIEISYNTFTNVTLQNNYIAAIKTVPGGCIYDPDNSAVFTNAPVFKGNVNMVSGNTIGGFGVCP